MSKKKKNKKETSVEVAPVSEQGPQTDQAQGDTEQTTKTKSRPEKLTPQDVAQRFIATLDMLVQIPSEFHGHITKEIIHQLYHKLDNNQTGGTLEQWHEAPIHCHLYGMSVQSVVNELQLLKEWTAAQNKAQINAPVPAVLVPGTSKAQ